MGCNVLAHDCGAGVNGVSWLRTRPWRAPSEGAKPSVLPVEWLLLLLLSRPRELLLLLLLFAAGLFPEPPLALPPLAVVVVTPAGFVFRLTFFVLGSLLSFFHFIRRFWNQILICRSLRTSVCAISIRLRLVR